MRRSSAYLYVGSASILWGLNGVIVNLVELHPLVIAFFRVLIGALTLLIALILLKGAEILHVKGSLKKLMLLGVLLASGWYLLFQSMKLIPIGAAVLINYLAPIFVAVFAPPILGEKPEIRVLIAMILSTLGVFLISREWLSSGGIMVYGVISGLLAAISYGWFVIVSKQVLDILPCYTVAVYTYFISALILSPSILLMNSMPSTTSLMLLLMLGVVNTSFAVTLYFKGLKILKAQEAAAVTYLEPLSAIIFGYFILSQELSPEMLLGGAFILASQYLVMK